MQYEAQALIDWLDWGLSSNSSSPLNPFTQNNCVLSVKMFAFVASSGRTAAAMLDIQVDRHWSGYQFIHTIYPLQSPVSIAINPTRRAHLTFLHATSE